MKTYEHLPLDEKEKELRRYAKDKLGIESKGPLGPEFIKERYNSAFAYERGMDRIANSAEESAAERDDPQQREYIQKQAERYRRDGQFFLETTMDDIKKYVKKNSVTYQEQAKTEMENDFAEREKQAGFEDTLKDIKDLPESDAGDTDG